MATKRISPAVNRRFEVYDRKLAYIGSTTARSWKMAVEYFAHRGAFTAHEFKPAAPAADLTPKGRFDHCVVGSHLD